MKGIPSVPRSTERLRKLGSTGVKHALNHTGPHYSLRSRLLELTERLERDPGMMIQFSAACDLTRNPRSAALELGLRGHRLLSPWQRGAKDA